MTGGAGQGGASSDIGGAAADAQFATIQRRMAETFQSLERDEQGFATANALMAVVSAMKAIPGRKSVVFFTEGLAIPPNVKARFESVIDAANRANVSIYPMDAAGLRTLSTTKETLDGVNEASAVTLGRDPTADVTDRPMMMALEKNEDLLRADPHSGLGQLADQTGGFLIANTNNLRNGFERIDTDMRNYYVLTYVSKNPVYDGKFRTIDVKVKRNGARIALAQGLLRPARAVRRPRARLRGAGDGRARSPEAAERLPGTGAVAALPRRRSARAGTGARHRGDGGRGVQDIAGAEAPGIRLHRPRPHQGQLRYDDREDVAALSAAGPDRPAGQHQDA